MTRQQIFDQGIYAYAGGVGFLANPYLDTDITNARIWIDGYVSALIAHREAKKVPPPGEGA